MEAFFNLWQTRTRISLEWLELQQNTKKNINTNWYNQYSDVLPL